MKIKIYTDGACSGNPGIGGWGAVILTPNKEPVFLSGGSIDTTNNQMELTAVIESLKYFKELKQLLIFTDSKYVINGIETWIKNWKKNGWITANKKTVKNKNLWENLDKEITRHEIEWHWVKGHAGNINNEKADFLARQFIEKN